MVHSRTRGCRDEGPVDEPRAPGTVNHVDWIYRNIYSAERSALMHAKRKYLLPQDASSKQRLIDSIANLWTYVSDLIKARFGVTRRNQSGSSGIRVR